MTREEEKQLAYREERDESAMFHICRELYEIDVPNHPVKDGYRIGFDEGVEYIKKILIEKACEWLKENIDIYAKVVINPKSHYPEIVMCDSFEKRFKKAMEE